MDDDMFAGLEALGMRSYDKNGRPITLLQLFELSGDLDYRTIGHWESDDGHWRISTVWLGTDHSYGRHGPPLIFETMSFYEGTGESRYNCACVRYQTLAEAERGHELTVKCIKEARAPFDWAEKPFDWL